MKNNFLNILSVTIFIFFLSMPFVGLYLGMTSQKENTEWRRLAEFPKINSKMKIKEFPKRFEQFYSDNYGFRNILLNLEATIDFEIFKKSPQPGVLRVTGEWYYHNEARSMAPNYKLYYHHIIFSDQQLKVIDEIIASDKSFLAEKGIPYLFVIVPDKEIIYPEHYPFSANTNANIQLSQILDILYKNKVETLYLKPQLTKARYTTDLPIYYRQDAHWNSLGAFYGYQAIMEDVKKKFPDIYILQLSDFNIRVNATELKHGYDLHRLKSLIETQDQSKEPVIYLTIKPEALAKIKKIDKAYIYCDSYFVGDAQRGYLGGALYFLKYNFNDMVIINDALWGLEKEKIDQEKPDIVIREVIQRNIYKYFAQTGVIPN